MRAYTAIIGMVAGAIVVMALVFGMDVVKMSISTEKYSVFVDPIIDQQSLFVVGRVTVQNTGSEPLTNVRVNFGSGDAQDLPVLKPGQKIILTPPEDNPMEIVTVSADNGVYEMKGYRELPKMVGMMGS